MVKKKTTKEIRAIDRIIKFQIDDGIESLTIAGKEALADLEIDNKNNVTLYLNADKDKINELHSLVPFINLAIKKDGVDPDKTKSVTLSQDLTQFALEIAGNSKELASLIKSESSIILDLDGLVQKLLEIAGKLAELEAKNLEQDNRLTVIESKNLEQDNRLTVIETKDLEQDGRLTTIEAKNLEQDNRLTVIESKDLEQDNRLTVIESKDLEQDNRLTVIETKDLKQDNRLTVIETKDLGQDKRLTVIESKDLKQDNRLTDIETKDLEQDKRLTVIESKDLEQDNRLTVIETKDLSYEDYKTILPREFSKIIVGLDKNTPFENYYVYSKNLIMGDVIEASSISLPFIGNFHMNIARYKNGWYDGSTTISYDTSLRIREPYTQNRPELSTLRQEKLFEMRTISGGDIKLLTRFHDTNTPNTLKFELYSPKMVAGNDEAYRVDYMIEIHGYAYANIGIKVVKARKQ